MRKRRAVPVILAMLAFTVGGAWAWQGLPPFQREASDICPRYQLDEGTRYTTHHTWPPGAIDCTYTTLSGNVAQSRFVPRREYLLLALFATAVGVGSTALLRGSTHKSLRVSGAGALFIAGWIVFVI